MTNVPLLDLKAQYAQIRDEVMPAIEQVCATQRFILGEQVLELEAEVAGYCGASVGVGVSSGTDALLLALMALGVGVGDEIITSPFTFFATAGTIARLGARPVFCDIDPASFNLSPTAVADFVERRCTLRGGQLINRATGGRVKGLMPVHLYGQSADMDPIMEIARRHRLVVIEDAAQAHGAKYKGHPVGSIGDIACFSFYPGKNLGAYGEGGAVTTSNPEHAHTIRMLRDWGQDRKYHHLLRGFNYRMEGFQGAILRVKLRHLEAWTEARRAVVRLYDELLADAGVETPTEMPWGRHVYHVYTLRSDDRDGLQAALQADGIQTGIHYPVPAHLQPAYADLGYGRGAFPQSEAAAEQVLSLPLYPELPPQAVAQVAGAVKKAIANRTQTAVSR